MRDKLTRRDMLISGLGTSASLMALSASAQVGISGLSFASIPSPKGEKLSPEEKKILKEQLQRELERKVYAVSDELFRKVNHVKTPGSYEGHEESHIPVIKTIGAE